LRRIRWLTRTYDLQWLVDQESADETSLSILSSNQLQELLVKLERAHQCIVEGIGFDEAGLVKPMIVEPR